MLSSAVYPVSWKIDSCDVPVSFGDFLLHVFSRLSPAAVGEIFDLRRRDVISSSVLPLLLEAAYDSPTVAPSILVAERGWSQISDQAALASACDAVLRTAADKVRIKYLPAKSTARLLTCLYYHLSNIPINFTLLCTMHQLSIK